MYYMDSYILWTRSYKYKRGFKRVVHYERVEVEIKTEE